MDILHIGLLAFAVLGVIVIQIEIYKLNSNLDIVVKNFNDRLLELEKKPDA